MQLAERPTIALDLTSTLRNHDRSNAGIKTGHAFSQSLGRSLTVKTTKRAGQVSVITHKNL